MQRSEREFNRRETEEFPTRNLRLKYKKNVKGKELEINLIIKSLLREEIWKMLKNFIETFEVNLPEIDSVCKSLFDLILSKCKSIMTMVFFQNRKKFFKLIRKNPKIEKKLVEVWEELVKMYDYFRVNDVNSPPVLRQFVKGCLRFPSLQEEIIFLFRYMFKVTILYLFKFRWLKLSLYYQ